MARSKNMYEVEVFCFNCGNTGVVEGKIGVPLTNDDIRFGNVCDVCGCKDTLIRAFPTPDDYDEEGDEETVKVPSPRF